VQGSDKKILEIKGREMKEKTANNLLSRRQTLRLMGAAGATAVVAFAGEPAAKLLPAKRRVAVANAATLDCVVRPQLTEGPYFVDEKLNRSDIRTDPSTMLIVRKAGKFIAAGQTVSIQVMNSDNALSEGFSFLRI
jgi:hypothetical protein